MTYNNLMIELNKPTFVIPDQIEGDNPDLYQAMQISQELRTAILASHEPPFGRAQIDGLIWNFNLKPTDLTLPAMIQQTSTPEGLSINILGKPTEESGLKPEPIATIRATSYPIISGFDLPLITVDVCPLTSQPGLVEMLGGEFKSLGETLHSSGHPVLIDLHPHIGQSEEVVEIYRNQGFADGGSSKLAMAFITD
jgi:hypothetical protein